MTTGQRAWHADIMGMPISIRLRGDDVQSATIQSRVDKVFDLLRRVDSVFSTYRCDSELMRQRRGELPLRACDPMVREVFELCAEAATRTEGWFDPQTDTRDTRTTHGGRVLDPTGVVKGWAVQRGSELLAELDQHDHYINAAGDIAMTVRDDGAPPWRLGVADPHHAGRLVDVVGWRTGGMATSGTAARGGHVYDPFTGRPATALASVTVLGPELVWADVYATAGLARGGQSYGWLNSLTDYEHCVVTADGQQRHSAGWPALRVGPSR